MMMLITDRIDGRFMGRLEIESQYRHRIHITVLEVNQEWIVAVANRVKESSYANYRT